MKSFLVYGAGPITGLTYEGATGWREEASRSLTALSGGRIELLDPMRHKDYLADQTSLADTYDETVLSSQRGIYGRDRLDCLRSDLVLVNLLGAQKVSIGTVMEIAWADSRKIPIVLAMERDGNPHDHAMLREACYWRVTTIDEAVRTAVMLLVP